MTDSELPDFDALWDYDKPDASEAQFARLLAEHPAAEKSWRAQLLTQLARSQGLQRKFAEAHATLDQAQALLDDSAATARTRYLLERGRVFRSAGDAATGREFFVQSRDAALQHGEDNYAVDAIHMLAIVDPPEASIEWNRQAIAIAQRSDDQKAQHWVGSLTYNNGWALHDMGRFAEARESFRQAARYWGDQGRASDALMAEWSAARALRSSGRYDEALAELRALEPRYDQLGQPKGYYNEEIGENLLAMGHADRAAPYFRQAHAELVKDIWLAANEPERLARLAELGT